jgi:hypothetical protein
MSESPRWVPILMAVLIGLGFLLGGQYTATKWR